jgi:ribonuclease-3
MTQPLLLGRLLEELPEDLARQVFTHASWSERRSDSYARLAFLGDSVLALAVTAHLYPRLEAERFGAGRLTKIRAQAVSGPSCRAVAERLRLPERLRAAAPPGVRGSAEVVTTERVLASVIEAVIGACYLHAGYERTGQAVVEAFSPEIEGALEHPVDFKSALQELLARRGARRRRIRGRRPRAQQEAGRAGSRADRGRAFRGGAGAVSSKGPREGASRCT